jgi:hypothetical protein
MNQHLAQSIGSIVGFVGGTKTPPSLMGKSVAGSNNAKNHNSKGI